MRPFSSCCGDAASKAPGAYRERERESPKGSVFTPSGSKIRSGARAFSGSHRPQTEHPGRAMCEETGLLLDPPETPHARKKTELNCEEGMGTLALALRPVHVFEFGWKPHFGPGVGASAVHGASHFCRFFEACVAPPLVVSIVVDCEHF